MKARALRLVGYDEEDDDLGSSPSQSDGEVARSEA